MFARVRGLFPGEYAPDSEGAQSHINQRGDTLVAQALPELTELVRLGNSFQCATTTGQAALTSLPTTTAGISLNNLEPANGRCYAIDSFGSWEAVVDATQTDVTAIFAMLNGRQSAQASSGTQETGIRSLNGRLNGSLAYVRRGATVVNDGWFAHGIGGQMAAAAAGANWKCNEVQARGLYLVVPGGSFSVQAVKAAAAAAAQQFFFIRWHEVNVVWTP